MQYPKQLKDAFLKGPFNFVKKILGKPNSWNLEIPINEVEQHLADAYNVKNAKDDLAHNEDFITHQRVKD